MKTRIALAAIAFLCLLPGICSATGITVFGTHQYVRKAGPLNVYFDTFPAIAGPGKIIIKNGDADGKNRVCSAWILVNGISVVGPYAFNQLSYDIEASLRLNKANFIVVTMMSRPGTYLTVEVMSEVTPDATSTAVIGIEGGTVSVPNHLGDVLTLDIPPLALGVPTKITVSSIPASLPAPVNTVLYPGAILEPEGLQFSLPVRIRIAPHAMPRNSPPAMVYWFQDAKHLLPLGNQAATQTGFEADTLHFSDVYLFGPLDDTLKQELKDLETLVATYTDWNVDFLIDTVRAYQSIAYDAEMIGDDSLSAQAYADAQQALITGVDAILSQPLPGDPCGMYSTRMEQLAVAVDKMSAEYAALAERLIYERHCDLEVTPNPLNLALGQTSGSVLTAVLFDPKKTPRSCTNINWYSDRTDIADCAAASGSVCSVQAAGAGTANISANCDGVIGSSKVVVNQSVMYFTGSVGMGGLLYSLQSDCVFSQTMALQATGRIELTAPGSGSGEASFAVQQSEIWVSGAGPLGGDGNPVGCGGPFFETGAFTMPLTLSGSRLTGTTGTQNSITLDAIVGESSLIGTITHFDDEPFFYADYSAPVSWPVSAGSTP